MENKGAAEALSIDPASLYSAFEQVRDGRKKKGKRYPLPLLLTLLMLGKLAGETTVNGIVDWIKERQGWLRGQLNWPKRFPTNSTYSEALARCDAEQIVTVIARRAAESESRGTVWERTQPIAGAETGRDAHPCGDGWQNLTRHARTPERGTALGASVIPL